MFDRSHRSRRGLCQACYFRQRVAGTLDRWPLVTHRDGAAVVADAVFLASAGESPEQLVVRLGYTNPGSLRRLLSRRGCHELARQIRAVERREETSG